MRLALIPPKGFEQSALKSNIHLTLAHLTDYEYWVPYFEAKQRGDYIIVDNGAAEDMMVERELLLQTAIDISADEVVLPDVFYDREGTLAAIAEFFKGLPNDLGFKYMGVVQGTKSSDPYQILQAYANDPGIKTIGIPRHWIDTRDNEYARFNICEMVEQLELVDRFEVHLLGASPRWPGEVLRIGREFPWLRSIDTSLPFSYTINSMRLENNKWADFKTASERVDRPNKYFDEVPTLNRDLLESNLNTYMEWAHGTEGTES
jgi:hypothetical protein